jgi:hypothetical protein
LAALEAAKERLKSVEENIRELEDKYTASAAQKAELEKRVFETQQKLDR